jgi:hypothetical protein
MELVKLNVVDELRFKIESLAESKGLRVRFLYKNRKRDTIDKITVSKVSNLVELIYNMTPLYQSNIAISESKNISRYRAYREVYGFIESIGSMAA